MSDITSDTFENAFLRFIEEETKIETEKIVKKYQDQMIEELEVARSRIVAQAGVRLSSMISYHDLGHSVRIEIVKQEKQP